MSEDRFVWLDNEEDEVRVRCSCGWLGPWRDRLPDVRADERTHQCQSEPAR